MKGNSLIQSASLKLNSIAKKPYLFFLPFLIAYILFIIIKGNGGLNGDELRYLRDARNLLKGYYSPPMPGITLFSGPGYPIILAVSFLLHIPVIGVKLLNAFFLYFSIILLYKTLINRVSLSKTLLCCFFWICYFNHYVYLRSMVSEIITPFVVTLLLFLVSKAFDSELPEGKRRRYMLLAGFVFGYLALIKVIFGYVILCMLAGSTAIWLTNPKSKNYRRAMVVLIAAFITVLPYLVYTYKLTGRVMYWSSLGGNNLYWMSRYSELENGSWFATPYVKGDSLAFNTTGAPELKEEPFIIAKEGTLPGYPDSILKYDTENLVKIAKLKSNPLAQDDAFKEAAMENIKAHPMRFIQNCFSNAGRMLFNFPYSYTLQKSSTLFWLPLNGILVVLSFLCLIPAVKNWRQIPYFIRFMLFVAIIYFGGSILGSAEIRMFTSIVPVLLVAVAYIMHKTVKIAPGKWQPEQ
jgi:hypothetical protein